MEFDVEKVGDGCKCKENGHNKWDEKIIIHEVYYDFTKRVVFKAICPFCLLSTYSESEEKARRVIRKHITEDHFPSSSSKICESCED